MNKSLLKKFKKPLLTSAISVAALAASIPSQAEVTAMQVLLITTSGAD